jgi:endonuclease/exonuclease/phosphatase (EEP) superfamily protein YafD
MPVWPYLLPLGTPSSADADQPIYRILSLNLLTSNKQYDAVRNLILESQPDFVVLLETNERWEVALSPISERYPYSQFISQPGTSFRDSWAACDSIT